MPLKADSLRFQIYACSELTIVGEGEDALSPISRGSSLTRMRQFTLAWLWRCVFSAALLWAATGKAIAAGNCPTVKFATSCALVIEINPNGTLSFLIDPNILPFDDADDQLIGVVNNSGATVFSITLEGRNTGSGIFGFDGDGLCKWASIPCGATGYEGPNTYFTITNPYLGVVNFPNGEVAGQIRTAL